MQISESHMQIGVEMAVFFSLLNAAILLGLIWVYARILLKTHARYTLGLIIFAGLLFLQNVVTLSSYLFMIQFYSWRLYPVMDVITVFEFAALLALLKVSL
jgi:hypothetical protein